MIIWAILQYSLIVSVVAIMILALKEIFHDKLDARWHYFVWLVLAVRMAVPASPGWLKTPVSLFQTVPVSFWIKLLREYVRKSGLEAAAQLAGRIYLAGVTVLLAYYLISCLILKWKVFKSPNAPEAVCRRVAEIASCYGLKNCRSIRIVRTNTPYICGLYQPVLVLSPQLADSLEGSEAVIVHELLHQKYRDVLVNYLLRLVRAVNWFNPLIWYITAVVQNDGEALCDQRVLELMNQKGTGSDTEPVKENTYAREYGSLLISMAERKSTHAAKTGTSNMANSYRSMKLRIRRIADFGKVPSGIGIAALGITVILSISSIGYCEETGKIFKSTEINSEKQLSEAILCARVFDAKTPEEAIYLYLRAMRYGNPLYLMAVMPERWQEEYEEWMLQTYWEGGFVTGKEYSIYGGEGWIDYPLDTPDPWFPEDGYVMQDFKIHNLMLNGTEEGTAAVQIWLPYTEEYLLWELELTLEEGWKVQRLAQETVSADGFAYQEPLFSESISSGNWKITLEGRNEADFASHFTENAGFFSFPDQNEDTEEYPEAFDMSYKWCGAYVTWLGEEPLDAHQIKVIVKTKEENPNSGDIRMNGGELQPGSRFTVFENGTGYAYRRVTGSRNLRHGFIWMKSVLRS